MLDADRIVIACKTKLRSNCFPVIFSMTVAYGTEDPGTGQFFAVMLSIQHAVYCRIDRIYLGILCMEMEDRICFAQLSDHSDQIHSLPDQVAGIQVRADFRTNCLTQL